MAVVLNQRLVCVIIDLELDLGAGELRKLHGFLKQSYPSLLESDSPDPVIHNVLDVYLLAAHLN